MGRRRLGHDFMSRERRSGVSTGMELNDLQLARLQRRVRRLGMEIPSDATPELLLVMATLADLELRGFGETISDTPR